METRRGSIPPLWRFVNLDLDAPLRNETAMTLLHQGCSAGRKRDTPVAVTRVRMGRWIVNGSENTG